MRRAIKRLLMVTLLMTVLGVFGLLSPASAAVLDQNEDPTVQTNGQVRSIVQVGDRIYLGGTFTSVDGQPRSKLAAIDATSGAVTDWRPRTDKQVWALAASPDGSRIYAGGSFTKVNGTARTNLVALDAATGQIASGWSAGEAQPNNQVWSLATLGDRVYFGGYFTSVSGERRARLAAVDGATGELDPNWTPRTNENVRTLVPSLDGTQIYAGGQFTSISGQRRLHLAALSPTTGAVSGWRPNPCYPVFDLDEAKTRTGTAVYVAGGGVPEDCNAGGWAEAFTANVGDSLSTGKSRWKISSNGDFQAVAVLDGIVYYGGHFDEIPFVTAPDHGETWLRFAAVKASSGALLDSWKPTADQGIWAMTANQLLKEVYAGGVFTEINGRPQVGYTKFSLP